MTGTTRRSSFTTKHIEKSGNGKIEGSVKSDSKVAHYANNKALPSSIFSSQMEPYPTKIIGYADYAMTTENKGISLNNDNKNSEYFMKSI